jgi:hypothetical protein
MKVAQTCGRADEIRERIKQMVAGEAAGGFVTKMLGRELGLQPTAPRT